MKNQLLPIILLCTAITFNAATINKTRKQTKAQIIELKQQVDSINHKLDERTYILELNKALSEKRDIQDIQIP